MPKKPTFLCLGPIIWLFSVALLVSLAGCLPGVPSRPSSSGNSTEPTRDEPLALGNPSGANNSDPDNYLMAKPVYALSYNRQRGTANWVSWHLSASWKGPFARANNFRPDPDLPPGWYAAKTTDYTNTGFDRGHLCPSDDRDASPEDNSATFLMTNIVPQAPQHNRVVWKNLEDYCRSLLAGGNELYITAGVIGSGGTGENGRETRIADGNITVPASLYKIVVVLPVGSDDISRISTNTRAIAVNIPNRQTAADRPWGYYLVSVDELEEKTGYDFLNRLPTDLQRILEARKDVTN